MKCYSSSVMNRKILFYLIFTLTYVCFTAKTHVFCSGHLAPFGEVRPDIAATISGDLAQEQLLRKLRSSVSRILCIQENQLKIEDDGGGIYITDLLNSRPVLNFIYTWEQDKDGMKLTIDNMTTYFDNGEKGLARLVCGYLILNHPVSHISFSIVLDDGMIFIKRMKELDYFKSFKEMNDDTVLAEINRDTFKILYSMEHYPQANHFDLTDTNQCVQSSY